ncbi:MAG TPA: ABC transporter ATP-binding protein [Acidimicrobiales bacterium]|nr:ABC transporter ATP-binding protein [Acidimicrobiales bacterium]
MSGDVDHVDHRSNHPILEVCDVHLSYGNVVALDGVDLGVDAGEWVAVAGPSGSGKSTLLALLAALDHPDRGDIRYRGRSLVTMRHLDRYRRREVGLVFQLHDLVPHLDARQNVEVAMFGTSRRRSARRRAADELLAWMQLDDLATRRPAEMSGGERQRVAIARALSNRPPVVLADEPTGNLDPESADNVVDVFRRLHRDEGTSIVMVTHDASVAAAADRVVTLERGRIVGAESARSVA